MLKKKIGIYGGTFSPPHLGHVGAAENFLRTVELDKLLIMPDYLPPHKVYDGKVTADDRMAMCRLAFFGLDKCEISDLEIKRGGKSFTSVTLEELSNEDVDLYFLCGTDMFLTLSEWYRAELIFKLATICYVRRENDIDCEKKIEKLTFEYQEKYNARIIAIDAPLIEVSSSELRTLIANKGESSRFLSDEVYQYILRKELYQ